MGRTTKSWLEKPMKEMREVVPPTLCSVSFVCKGRRRAGRTRDVLIIDPSSWRRRTSAFAERASLRVVLSGSLSATVAEQEQARYLRDWRFRLFSILLKTNGPVARGEGERGRDNGGEE